jgi:hypothetical protein
MVAYTYQHRRGRLKPLGDLVGLEQWYELRCRVAADRAERERLMFRRAVAYAPFQIMRSELEDTILLIGAASLDELDQTYVAETYPAEFRSSVWYRKRYEM